MPKIIPTILATTYTQFEEQFKKVSPFFDLIQIDVMDGKFVSNQSFAEIDNINNVNLNAKFELHLMVEHPIEEIKKWKNIKNIVRIIFHIESKDNPEEVIKTITDLGVEVGIAINPETNTSAIEPYINQINEVLFLTVHPGKQGAEFLPEVGKKIRNFNKTNLKIAVDGGINEINIEQVCDWGVDTFCIGSAIIMAEDTEKAKQNLLNQLSS
ncbi:MAG: Ribulose-phosphate 3-epimerase [Candidatus Magasanikbacteria bacterium GW2011_GWC2_34_16]|uniref:Ribulose-phosphate 3-epimerase n=2 Tax=Candidatus Magasanikiibacteriota TaxID=1752731 RepID=A0A0G0HR88_9BACT|nr:MAG: Ribulose-phosphate 3-epimerase [Candidatus Magasanikbacteria bacterium GW2011_GWC2_34_16]KKQ41105.1 MAG: Ribulose-phosphate 3-epimerase [Candidatus Magasanikbacteria bacterium GW2011_GWA2_37_8]